MANTLLDLATTRAVRHPDRGYRFLADGVATSETLSYAELDRACRTIAVAVRRCGVGQGARALLLYAPGLEFVKAFWACFYAGIIAVPAPPLDPARAQRTVTRLRAIAQDCKPALVLTDGVLATEAELRRSIPALGDATVLDTAKAAEQADSWLPPELDGEAVAAIQYTSGSTGTPRGVVVSHRNFLHNLAMLHTFHGNQEHMVMVHWLPLFHDMGLIRGMMSPLHMGGDCVMMPPMRFIERPRRWLDAVTRFRGTTIGAPSFGYELCNRKVARSELEAFDLSRVRVAFCSAEPIRASTVRRFIERFGSCGFARSAFRPSYGLAEATVMVAGELGVLGPKMRTCDRLALRANRLVEIDPRDENSVEIVSCGRSLGGQGIAIVNASGVRAVNEEVGEIWVRGRSVANGYWQRPAATAEVFGCRLADGDGPYLKTGDLGWLSPDGELFVTGRKKDVIIVRGENHYPHDIESVVEDRVPELRPGCSVAFAVEDSAGEHVVVACEPAASDSEPVDWTRLLAAVRGAVSEVFGLALGAVAFVARGTIPKTASGKVQRGRARQSFLRGELALRHVWTAQKLNALGEEAERFIRAS